MYIAYDKIFKKQIGEYETLLLSKIAICEYIIYLHSHNNPQLNINMNNISFSEEFEVYTYNNNQKEIIDIGYSDEEFREKMKNRKLLRILKIEQLCI